MPQQNQYLIPAAKVEFEEAKLLADLGAINNDLASVIDILTRLCKELENNSSDWTLIDSYFTAALIKYIRCFSTGKRYGLKPENIYSDIEGAIAFHTQLKDMRDKHIAHSVNPFEEMAVDIQLNPFETGEKKIIGVSTLCRKLITFELPQIKDFQRLAILAANEVSRLGKEAEQNVLKKAKLIPIEELYAKSRSELITPGYDQSGKSRK
jgi:hypothetical protein